MAKRQDNDWTAHENETIVSDYFDMLMEELSGRSYNKAAHNRQLQLELTKRSRRSIEDKHQNISAVLIELGCPYIAGYKPYSRYQRSLQQVVFSRLESSSSIRDFLATNADRAAHIPVLEDVLSIEEPAPEERVASEEVAEGFEPHSPWRPNYLEREARNRELGVAGEFLAMEFERARLRKDGRSDLADQIEHVSETRGDGDGFDILSFDTSGRERFIEVKTTKGGVYTPFFVTRNELRVSQRNSEQYHLYRLFAFERGPRLYGLRGNLAESCLLTPSTFVARVG